MNQRPSVCKDQTEDGVTNEQKSEGIPKEKRKKVLVETQTRNPKKRDPRFIVGMRLPTTQLRNRDRRENLRSVHMDGWTVDTPIGCP